MINSDEIQSRMKYPKFDKMTKKEFTEQVLRRDFSVFNYEKKEKKNYQRFELKNFCRFSITRA